MSAARRTRDYGVWWMSIPYGTTGLLMELVRRIPSPFPRLFSSFHVRFEALVFYRSHSFQRQHGCAPLKTRNGALDWSELTQLDVLGNWRGRVRGSQLVWTTLNLAVPLPIVFL